MDIISPAKWDHKYFKHIVSVVDKQENFVVQVIEIKKMQGDSMLLIVSDGIHECQL